MKKILSFLLVICMFVTLSACGKKAEETGTTGDANNGTSTLESDDLIGLMSSENYYVKYTMESELEGTAYNAKGETARKGEDIAVSTEMEYNGAVMKTRTVKVGGESYVVDDTNKTITKSIVDIGDAANKAFDYSTVNKTGNGKGTIKGKELPYTEYTTSEGYVSKFYTDNGKPYAIESTGEGVTAIMIVEEYSKNPPSSLFELPSDYTKVAY
ncbi:MAG: hypothetical protein LBM38_02200 [Clostridiales bacterium]|jgi:hypothetical protein|nr:hypothetical protein [Clostridiales bacterium]